MEKTNGRPGRLCDKLPIVDVFTSIQGEGIYIGEPSVFVRVSGCNLRCCFKNTICDTAYSSFKPEKGHFKPEDILKELTDNPNVRSIVITGGEPMLYADMVEDLIKFIEDVMDMDYHVTVETNGTRPPCNDTLVDLYSISPKLSTSVPEQEPRVYVDQATGDTYTFTKEECERLNAERYNPKAIAAMIDQSDFQLKFVYSGPESVTSIIELLKDLDKLNAMVLPEDVLLMPEGVTNELITENAQEAARVCIDHGWRLSDRLHIRVWGDKRGV